MVKTARGTAELVALRDRLVRESTRIERLLKEVERALSGKPAGKETAPPRPGPLDEINEVLAATADLRTQGGNLSAERVASLYGVSMNQLAGWLGKSLAGGQQNAGRRLAPGWTGLFRAGRAAPGRREV